MRSLAILLLVATATTLSSKGPSAVASSACTGSAFVTVTKNESGRVLRARKGGPDGARSFGCLYKFDNRVPLDNPNGAAFTELAQPRSFRLAGWLVGYARDYIGGDGLTDAGGTDIVVRSLHPRGRFRRSFRAEPDEYIRSNCTDEDCDTRVAVTDLVLRGKGAVAWIVCPDTFISSHKRRCIEQEPASVYKADSTAKKRVRLDHASGIDIFSLRLSRSTLSWTRDGKTYTASLR